MREFPEDQYVFFATAQGMVKKVQLSAFKNVRSQGIKAIALKEGDYLVGAAQTGGADDIMLFSNLGKAIRFNEYWEKSGNDEAEDADIETENEDSDCLDDENAENALPSGKHGVRPSGRGSGGLRGMRLPADGKIVSLITFAPEAEQSDLQVLTATANGYGKRTPIADYSRKNKRWTKAKYRHQYRRAQRRFGCRNFGQRNRRPDADYQRRRPDSYQS